MPGGFGDLEAYGPARVLRRRVWKLSGLLPPEERCILSTCEDENCFEKAHLDDMRAQAHAVARPIGGYIAYLNRKMDEADGRRGTRRGPPARGPTDRSTDQPVNRARHDRRQPKR